MRSIWAAVLVLASGCTATLRDGVFRKGDVQYRIVAPDDSAWQRVGFADNDLAWVAKTGHVISTNATCGESHGDPPLEVLTQHLLFGFSDREQKEQNAETLDGREALHSKYQAKLDGVLTDIELIVLKKNNCVHDFTYVSPVGEAPAQQAAFDRLVKGFTQEKAP